MRIATLGRVRTDRKVFVVLAAVALLAAGCSSGSEQPDTVAGEFVEALNRDDLPAAAALTDNPAQAGEALRGLYEGLGSEVVFRVADAEEGRFTLAATWKLGKDGKREWTYTTTGTAAESGDDWAIHWNPATVAPGLDKGPLTYAPVYPEPARVLDASGGELMTEQVVTLVNVAQGADTAALAAVLAPVAPTITAASLNADLAAAEGKPITPISLRASDIAPIQQALAAVPGVTLAPQTRLLTTDKSLAAPTLSGLNELWQQRADEAAGWAVRAQTPQGTERIAGQDPQPTTDITTTLDIDLQHAAEQALTPLAQPAAIVAVQPSTGKVVAVAQNEAADAQGPIALTGLYPPGSTFKTVTVSAALADGAVTPDTVLPCPGEANIEGRRIPNDDSFDLGEVPLHTAFARSCNTTMARLAVNLPPNALTDTAGQLGLGIDYVTPGLTTVTGSVPPANTPAERVESSIGQGTVTASPFGMALVAASLAHGSPPTPMLVAGAPGVADRTPQPLAAGVAEQVRTMMRETITAGTATQLADIPGLLGKTGTAEYGDNSNAHGWFVGIDGDLAFAVFVADAGSSAPAVDAAGRMLRGSR
ncbi:penicillin-binding transpeptidase domain-containing protein [Nocardia cyriacigeorgica]|uniref:penicillin-binding transpeptidase domain-containing protein n=1 Tax=Nocardia cyriacigeorgica TaxID=135487 RepID=UPI0006845BC0|nr:penicillin-binding transpeptidase domain-containing protein [Nocardia cyriacigeorgica]AVH24318.1 penicillin-binding protein [Nocardia cyriacigeorgica]MBF6323735.1 penicillin-binding protein [Nocardia cyriacigeorgica]MBF6496308.1 penicillin-binding protein [Nocardia cyriacigeorgica]PPJ16077.1 penicillin-binding protein [Nocardia cyriacigeorgica]TLF59088.1 penicillin-binding protein [Nocardia cyriacigeorgica]